MSFLPALPALGEKPPISLLEMTRLVAEGDGHTAKSVVEALSLESWLAEQSLKLCLADAANPVQIEAPVGLTIPEKISRCLNADLGHEGEAVWLTELWRAYYDHLEQLGKRTGSRLLVRWATWERALREQLARVRVTTPVETEPSDVDHRALLENWKTASDPMIAERVLDEGRWRFIEEEIKAYSFECDEFTAYMLKLRLLTRYASFDRAGGLKILEEVTIP